MAILPGADTLEALRPSLLRYAQHLLRNQWLAEDIVHETLLVILENPQRFRGQSSYTTYVFAILRNKMCDALRLARRHTPLDSDDEHSDQREHSAPYNQARADSPCVNLEQQDFLRKIDEGLQRLPERIAQVFVLSYGFELSNQEICQSMRLSRANLWTMLHRARTSLKHHLHAGQAPLRTSPAAVFT